MSGNYLVLCKEGRIELRDADSHAEVKSIPVTTSVETSGSVCSMSFGGSGTLLAVCTSFNKVQVYNVEAGEIMCEFENPEGKNMRTVTLNSAGTRLLTRCYEGRIDMWDLASKERIWSAALNSVNLTYPCVCFAADDQRVVTCLDDYRRPSHVILLDSHDGQQLMSLEGHKHVIRSIAVSPAGDRIASSANDKTVRVWDLSTGSCVRTFTGLENPVSSMDYFPDGRRLVISMEAEMTIYCVDTWNAMKTIATSHSDGSTFSLSINSVGSRIACTYWHNDKLMVCDIEQQSEIIYLHLDSHCSACCYSPGGFVLM
jgi:WD40 repeat protein